MARNRYRVGVGLGVVLAAGWVLALPALASPRSPASGRSSIATEATAVNLKVTDLSPSMKWAAAAPGKSSKAQVALAEKTVACLKKVGSVSPDPFGTRGVSGGVVEADVSSPTYYDKAASLTQLPSASSEVVVLTTASGARTDQATIARSGSLACLTAQLVGNSSLEGAGKVKGTASFASAPHYGQGNGGFRIQFIESGGFLPSKLYDNEYFYVQGNFEISMSFINLGAPFSSSWAASALKKVMARASSIVKT